MDDDSNTRSAILVLALTGIILVSSLILGYGLLYTFFHVPFSELLAPFL
ncbi:MAG: hypothetical protein ACFFD4_24425 [Candidatus Odinarchaeota archaeon]